MATRDLKIPEQRHPEKAHRPDNSQPKKPDWIRVKAPGGAGYAKTHKIMREHKLTTVCEEAGCPNVGECWSQGFACRGKLAFGKSIDSIIKKQNFNVLVASNRVNKVITANTQCAISTSSIG